MDPCGAWGDAGFKQRSDKGLFCAPRPVSRLAPCGRAWALDSRQGTVTTAEGSHLVVVHRRVCQSAAGVASCCSLSYDGLENGIFNFSGANLISHRLLLANHFANALGVTHQAGFEGLRMASASIDGPEGSFKLDDRTFASAVQAFNRLAAREIRHVCSRDECSGLYTSEVLAARREAEAIGEVWKPGPREGAFDDLAHARL